MRRFHVPAAITLALLLGLPSTTVALPCPIVGIFDELTLPVSVLPQFATAICDLNADGTPDILTSTTGLSVHLGSPLPGGGVAYQGATFYVTASEPREIACGDFNLDGAPDVAVACLGGAVYVFRGLKDAGGNPTGILAAPVAVSLGPCWGVDVADVNGDGLPDLVVGVSTAGISVLLGAPPAVDGNLVFVTHQSIGSGGSTKGLVLADLDLDGVLDIAAALENTNVAVFKGNADLGVPDGTFQVPFFVPADGRTYDVAIGDFNADGVPDIVSANYTGGTVSVLANEGGMVFTSHLFGTPGSPLGVQAADLNSDGFDEIVAAATGSGATISVFPGLGQNGIGDPSFGATVLFGVGNAYNVAVGNLDDSGGPDVIGALYQTSSLKTLLNNCTGTGNITLSVNVIGTGTVTRDPDLIVYPLNSEVTLTASSDPDHVFVTWGGATSGSTNPVTIVMDRAKTVSATFAPVLYPLSVTVIGEGEGAVTRLPNASGYEAGTTVQLLATPVLGSVFIEWTGDATGSANPIDVLIDGPKNVVAEFGADLNISPEILSIGDVPLDQGGKLKILWRASSWDRVPGDPLAFVRKYFVWREVPSSAVAAATVEPSRARPLHRTMEGDETYYWEFVTSLPASAFPGYSYTAETTNDSSGVGNPYTRFLVQARNADETMWWDSAPDSGYSVDNLAPPIPLPFTAVYGPSNALHWAPSRAPDLLEFRLYRGTSTGFIPGPATFVTATSDTGYVDTNGGMFHYKLVAVDVHGNPSAAALVSPDQPTAVLATLAGLETRPDRIVLRWFASGHRGVEAIVEKRTEDRSWSALDTLSFDGTGHLRYEDTDVVEGVRYGYRVAIFDAGEYVPAGETWATAVSPELAFLGAWPNPSTGGQLNVRFSLPDARMARIDLFDIGGRRILSHEAGPFTPGTHEIDLGARQRLQPGIYLMRFRSGGLIRTQRIAVLR